jgi:hypothetical protein
VYGVSRRHGGGSSSSCSSSQSRQQETDNAGSDNSHESFYPWEFIQSYLKSDRTDPEPLE